MTASAREKMAGLMLVLMRVLMTGAAAVASFTLQSLPAWADMLPRGIGIIQLGQRQYATGNQEYDHSGTARDIGDRFDTDLDSDAIMSGKGGADLQQLGEALAAYDGDDAGSPQSLSSRLSLGGVQGEVRSDVSATFLGLGYGLSDHFLVFAGVPWISASVEAELHDTGENNALAIREELGGLAFDELKKGLSLAAGFNAEQVKARIEAAGYAPIDHWSRSGAGDLLVGAKAMLGGRRRRDSTHNTLIITPSLSLPTGYVENPDVLTDISFGKGYYAVGLGLDDTLHIGRFFAGADVVYYKNLPAQVAKRVPEQEESIIAADRRATVNIAPGDDMEQGLSAGLQLGMFSMRYRVAGKRHFSDRYSGELEGNYEALGRDSSSYQAFHDPRIGFSTAEAYKRRRFPVPFIIEAGAHIPFEARNSPNERYFEISVSGFFSTPYARPDRPGHAGKAHTSQAGGRKRTARSGLTH